MRHGKMFDYQVRRLLQAWRRTGDPRLVEMASSSLAALISSHGAVLGRRLPPRFRPHVTTEIEPPASYEEGLLRHYPGYRLDPGYKVHRTRFTPENVPRRVTLRDCPFRHYHPGGADEVSPGLARYLSRPVAAEAVS
jgi:hypothetical protein